MTLLHPHETPDRRRRWAFAAAAWLIAIVLACALDHRVWTWITMGPEVEKRDWWQFLRVQGYLGVWAVAATALTLVRRPISPGAPGIAALLSAAAAGGLAELLKLTLGRARPMEAGEHVWLGLFAGFREHAMPLGLPSSHAAVAFGGWLTLAAAFPRLRGIAILMAAGCGLSRMLAGAHFLSDVVLAAALGALTTSWFSRLAGRTA